MMIVRACVKTWKEREREKKREREEEKHKLRTRKKNGVRSFRKGQDIAHRQTDRHVRIHTFAY